MKRITLTCFFILTAIFAATAGELDLLARPATGNLAANPATRTIHWSIDRNPGFWLAAPSPDWSAYNAFSFRIKSNSGTNELIVVFNSMPPGENGNYYYRKLKITDGEWQTHTWLFAEWSTNKKPVGFNAIQNVTFHSKGWSLNNAPGSTLEIAAVQLKSLSPEELKKPLPSAAAACCWPEGVTAKEIQAFTQSADFETKLAAVEKLRAARKPEIVNWADPQPRRTEAHQYLAQITPEGDFPDLNPEAVLARSRETNSPNARSERTGDEISGQAAKRLTLLLKCWNNGVIEQNTENREKLIKALNYYFDYDFNRTGYRWVGSCFQLPKTAAEAYFTFIDDMTAAEGGNPAGPEYIKLNQLCKAIVMQSFLYPERSGIPAVMSVERFRGSSAWEGGNFGYRPLLDCALICRNPVMIDIIAEVCSRALSVTSWNTRKDSFWAEGLTADGTGWGHGMQNYLFGYPLDGLRAVISNFARLQGTYWDKYIDPGKLSLAVDYLENMLWFCYAPARYGATMMTPGRIAMRYYQGRGFSPYPTYVFAQLEKLCPAEQPRLERLKAIAAGQAPEPSGIRYFWNQDDMIARRSDYFIGVNMTSARTASNEVIGSCSIKTEFLGDGATYLMKRPETYTLAKGFWNYTAIPGVTARQSEYKHPVDIWEGFFGCHNFAGGVTDEAYGVCAFIYEKRPGYKYDIPSLYKVEARKSYFFFEDEMLCLGSGVTNKNPAIPGSIFTAIDQTEWHRPIEYSLKPGEELRNAPNSPFRAESDDKAPALVCHAGIGYLILPTGGNRIVLSGENRRERWLEFDRNHNSKMPDRPRELPVMQLHIDHGREVTDGQYAYLVHMRMNTLRDLQDYSQNLPVQILSQNSKVHAAAHKKLNLTQAVFFEPGASFHDGKRTWTADAQAVIMIRELPDGSAAITASDPEQNPHKNTLTLSCDIPFHGKQKFSIPLPTGVHCGQAAYCRLP